MCVCIYYIITLYYYTIYYTLLYILYILNIYIYIYILYIYHKYYMNKVYPTKKFNLLNLDLKLKPGKESKQISLDVFAKDIDSFTYVLPSMFS